MTLFASQTTRSVLTDQDLRGDLRTLFIDGPERARKTPTPAAHTRRYWTGQDWQLGSAAYWETITREAQPPADYRLGRSFAEEVGACLLGGYGIPSAVALAAFERLREEDVFRTQQPDPARIEALLQTPFRIKDRSTRYRFPHQKAARLALTLDVIARSEVPQKPTAIRDWLMTLPGIGPKTASWVVRNHTGSDDVAIIDIHIIRAGTAAGVFSPTWRVASDYQLFEQAFLQWADHAHLPASFLDACIWGALAYAGADARDILGTERLSDQPRAVWPVDDWMDVRLAVGSD